MPADIEPRFVTTKDKVRLAYDKTGSTGPVLLLIHGTTSKSALRLLEL